MEKDDVWPLNLAVIRLAIMFWLLGWYCKSYFFLPYFLEVIFKIPVIHPLFPPFFLNPYVSVVFFFVPAFCIPSLIRPTKPRLIFSSILMTVSSLVMMLHINSYNDATFVTSFWVSFWIMWLAFQSHRTDSVLRQQACLLARLILGLIFFAGFVGKLTPEYLSGKVFYQIFWGESKVWPHNWLIAHFNPEQLKAISLYVSTFIIFSELLLACAPMFRSRFVFVLAPCILSCFMITNTWAIFSVVGCLIGMMVSCLFYMNAESGSVQNHA